MAEQDTPLEVSADPTLEIHPGEPAAQLRAKAGFCITAVLTNTHTQAGEKCSAVGQGNGLTASNPGRRRETFPSKAARPTASVVVVFTVSTSARVLRLNPAAPPLHSGRSVLQCGANPGVRRTDSQPDGAFVQPPAVLDWLVTVPSGWMQDAAP